MKRADGFAIDSKLDLVLERNVDVPPSLVWKAWTQPEHLKPWFAPKPWTTVGCEIDLRPGGHFVTVMRSPEGQEFPGEGCYLEVVENERLAWTSTMVRGYRPAPPEPEEASMPFTAIIQLEPSGRGTKYTAIAIHRDEAGRDKHEAMGFHEGWGTALDQLVAYVKGLRSFDAT